MERRPVTVTRGGKKINDTVYICNSEKCHGAAFIPESIFGVRP
jgi:hypothetical protein